MFKVYAMIAIGWMLYALARSFFKNGERRVPRLFLTAVVNLLAAPVAMLLSDLAEEPKKEAKT